MGNVLHCTRGVEEIDVFVSYSVSSRTANGVGSLGGDADGSVCDTI